MLKSALINVPKLPPLTYSYSTRIAVRLKGKAAKDLANDNTGQHIHIIDEKCADTRCEQTQCASSCQNPNGFKVKGHHTRKPPVGRMARYIDDHDAKGNPKVQYFVPVNSKKEFTEQERQQYGKDLEVDNQQQTFINDHYDKYD